jgi:prepilin-type N-terminal cleavage/methylation domain-containing protein
MLRMVLATRYTLLYITTYSCVMRANTSLQKIGKVKRCQGFSLVELLVVISLMTTLALLVSPGMMRARNHALESACAQNLRQWGVAFALYAAENDGFLPHPDDRRRDGGATGAARYPEHDQSWVDMLPPYLGATPWRELPPNQKPVTGFWQCPATRLLPADAYGYRPAEEGYHSYAMNSYLAHDFNFGLPWGAELQPSFLRLTRAATPSQTILLFEQTLDPSQAYGLAGSFPMAGYQTAEDARAATERHARHNIGLGGNVLHLDGSVRWRNDLWDESRRNPRIPQRGDPTWFPYPY